MKLDSVIEILNSKNKQLEKRPSVVDKHEFNSLSPERTTHVEQFSNRSGRRTSSNFLNNLDRDENKVLTGDDSRFVITPIPLFVPRFNDGSID